MIKIKEKELVEEDVNLLSNPSKAIEYFLNEGDYIDVAFNRIPSNANINKGWCGIGGTTLELKDFRNSLIIVPNISIIENKKQTFPEVYGVYGEVTMPRVAEYFKKQLENGDLIKIMSTPDSLYKIIDAAQAIEYNIYEDCFILLDESHSMVTEGNYRPNIIKPMDYFFLFKEKAMISATPYEYTDVRIDALDKHIIKSSSKSRIELNLIFSKSVLTTLKKVLNSVNEGNCHIFYNSVHRIRESIKLTGLAIEDLSVFCANNKDNIEALGEYAVLLKDFKDENVRKYNFYTTRYFEGIDLFDAGATIILVSDVYRDHTCFGVSNKGVQAIGRLRNQARNIYHITNTREEQMESITVDQIKEDQIISAMEEIAYYNKTIDHNFTKTARIAILKSLRPLIDEIADIDSVTEKALLNYTKVDIKINQVVASRQYLNDDTLVSAWEGTRFVPITYKDVESLSKSECRTLKSNRSSKQDKNKIYASKYSELYDSKNTSNTGLSFLDLEAKERLKESNPQMFKYCATLGCSRVAELNYNDSALKREYILKNASSIEVSVDISRYLNTTLKPKFYSCFDLKNILNEAYLHFGLEKNATASHISRFYNAIEGTKWIEGKAVRGFTLTTLKYRDIG